MVDLSKIDRRKFISKAGSGAALVMAWPIVSSCNSSSPKGGTEVTKSFEPDIDLELTAVQRKLAILPGNETNVWHFQGSVIKGDKNVLQEVEGSYLGPTIKVRKGQKIRIRFNNRLPEETIVHWHGMHVPEKYDGHPKDVIETGQTYVYEFEILNRAGTYWYHPHPHGRTGPQVYNGLAGLLLVTDEEEQRLNLPAQEFDVPVVIQDRSFDNENQLVYIDSRMDRMRGFLGNQILVNGKANHTLALKAGCSYRLRLLNGSNSRIYKLGWSDGSKVTVFGVDGSLLTEPKNLPYLMLGPAKRVDVWLDLTDRPHGTELTMENKSFPLEVMSGGMMGGGMMSSDEISLPQGSVYDVFKIKTSSSGSNRYKLPGKLAADNSLKVSDAINAKNPRQFTFAMSHMEWTINGRTWETTGVSKEEKVKLNTTEVWELINENGEMMMGGGGHSNDDSNGGGMMGNGGMMNRDKMGRGGRSNRMQMAHPIHLHQLQFNMLEYAIDEVDPELWDAVKDGFIKEGWHDTVLLMPGMRVKIIMRFENFKGLFLYHCHNLEHEDMGMMRNFLIS